MAASTPSAIDHKIPSVFETMPHSSSPTLFSQKQKEAMTRFFGDLSNGQDWDAIPSYSPIWKGCVGFLIKEYSTFVSLNSTNSSKIAAALEILSRLENLKEQDNIKQFFCTHVLTDPRAQEIITNI